MGRCVIKHAKPKVSANDRFSRLIEEKTCNDKSVSDCTPINPTIVSILRDTMEEKYDFFLFRSFLCTCYISGKIIINFRQSCWKLLLYSGIWIGIFCFSLSLSFSRLARFFALSRKIRTRYFGGIYYSIKYKNSLLVKESESWKKKLVSEVAPNNIGRCSSLLHFFPSFPTFLPRLFRFLSRPSLVPSPSLSPPRFVNNVYLPALFIRTLTRKVDSSRAS